MPSQQQLERLAAAVPFAQKSAEAYGVPASITLAQWITESSWGASKLALLANNYFGVKANLTKNTTASYFEAPTAEYENGKRVVIQAAFAKYPSMAESSNMHAWLLADSPRYAPAMKVAGNPEFFAAALQRCGYSTNPSYASDLLHLVHLYHLTDYDVPPLGAPVAKEAA